MKLSLKRTIYGYIDTDRVTYKKELEDHTSRVNSGYLEGGIVGDFYFLYLSFLAFQVSIVST